jgi:hypothetical protein
MSSESLFSPCPKCRKSVSKSAKRCPACGAKIGRLTTLHWVGIGVLALVLFSMFRTPDQAAAPISTAPSRGEIKRATIQNITLDFNWKKDSFVSIMEADFVIKNDSDQAVKDIDIQCDHFAKSGTKIDSNNRTLYDIIPAKSSKRFANFNMGFIHDQAKTSTCYVKDLALVNP